MVAHRRIYVDNVRSLCIKQNYYTHGDVVEYENMFNMVRNADADNVDEMEAIARDIWDHSDKETIMGTYNETEEACLIAIMYELYNSCCHTMIAER